MLCFWLSLNGTARLTALARHLPGGRIGPLASSTLVSRVSHVPHQPSRRHFLKTTAAAASVPYFSWGSPLIAQDAKTESKNDRPILGCIGTGDRWNAVGPQAMNFADCVAVCDVDSNHMAKGKTKALEQNAKKGRERTVEVYEDYRKLLDRKDIEVVTIVTPDHWHTKIAIDAMKAGKDVYCEKPLTLTIDEGKQILQGAQGDRARLSGRHAAAQRDDGRVNRIASRRSISSS